MSVLGLSPLCRDEQHCWHQGTNDGKEGEILTSSPCWWPVHCCQCNANAYAITETNNCHKYRGPAVAIKRVMRIKQGAF